MFQNDHFAALVPWWAVWPFEVLLVSRRHLGAMPELSADERDALADALKRLTTRYDNLFETSFPYTMGFHQAPTGRARIRSGISTRISIRRCCARPRCASSWWGLRCWACRSATSRRRTRQTACARPVKCISGRGSDGADQGPARPEGAESLSCGQPRLLLF